jgi:hypothetical protein
VCVAVSVEKGARRPPLPAAVVCRRLATTADLEPGKLDRMVAAQTLMEFF